MVTFSTLISVDVKTHEPFCTICSENAKSNEELDQLEPLFMEKWKIICKNDTSHQWEYIEFRCEACNNWERNVLLDDAINAMPETTFPAAFRQTFVFCGICKDDIQEQVNKVGPFDDLKEAWARLCDKVQGLD
ncbi:hypothetical protein INT48_008232 [Thamnidium elegans]|uniref:Uncharacterized protein n=1 Tax=Thamnidium elegans TaxID=101142 RepID=A0A8H7W2B2_9FUNG|nr:hypothetical protein INT48_008232 [Thamnidium elegans]